MKASYQVKHCGGRREANHADRTFDIGKAKNIKNNKTTGPTHILYQVGKNGEYQDYDKFREMVFSDIEYIEEHYQAEDARIKCLDVAFHGYDGAERSLHAHSAWSFEVRNKDGIWVQDTEWCLEKLGVELPDKTKPKDRYNNHKMTFTAAMQERWYDIVEDIDKGIRIDRTPAPKPVTNRHRAQQCIYEMGEIIDSIKTVQALLGDLDKCFDSLNQKDRKKHLEEVHNTVENSKHKFGAWKEKYMLKEEEALPVSDLIKDLEDLVADEDRER